MKIIVIGAGMVGASLTWELTQAGFTVTLLEAGEAGKGTSANSFAWINAHGKPPEDYHRLNAAGIEAHRDLAKRFGHAPWLNLTGVLNGGRLMSNRPCATMCKRCKNISIPPNG